jgi:predicted RecA/RadA family phage recombinase
MAIGETDDPNALIESFEAAADITKGSPVYLSADDKVSPSPGGDDAIGVATKTTSTGKMCPVLKRGRVKVTANGVIALGKAVCSAASGKVTQLVDQAVNESGSATYTIFYNRKLGTALEAASADGDLIFIDVEK